MYLSCLTVILTSEAKLLQKRIEGDHTLKKTLILTLSVIFLLTGAMLWAQEEGHGRAADVIINEIKQNQSVESITQIDPDLVSPALLEELGDAVMALMIGDEQQHEWMDEMMGGEGSEQLASVHRWLAYDYLQNNGNLATWGPGMMGNRNFNWQDRDWNYGPGRMMGRRNLDWQNSSWNYDSNRMMGWSGLWWGWIVVTIVIIIVIVVVVVALFRPRRSSTKDSHDPLEILRRRYAEGNISREEYQQILKELKE